MDFYKLYEIEDWTCAKVVEYYRANSMQKDWTSLEGIIKSFEWFRKAVTFDVKVQAVTIWTDSMKERNDSPQFKIGYQKVKQRILATGNATTNVNDNRHTGHYRDEVTAQVEATSVQKTPENQFYPPMLSTSLMSEILSDSLEQDEEDEQRNGFDGDDEFTFKDKELFT
ncbi:17216_t:CDS:2 [Funneliformis caledonium]|uniref:17216_t:CDS:1 n=1 Tax=Funneliformis caledonium TaxID=1117310 RepID=A0A9N9FMP6_9GLOM|nr:17216_t:CDS:2 [Funneliformis caledonium]